MADRAYLSITVYRCPEDKRQALHDIITETLNGEPEEDATLELGEEYFAEEMVLGADDQLYTAIHEKVGPEGLIFDLQQEGIYEHPAVRHIVVDGLGLFYATVTSSGTPVIDWDEVEPLLDDKQALRKAFGRPWLEALNEVDLRCKHCRAFLIMVDQHTLVDQTGGDVCGKASAETVGENLPHELQVYDFQVAQHDTKGMTIVDCIACQAGEPMLHTYEKRQPLQAQS